MNSMRTLMIIMLCMVVFVAGCGQSVPVEQQTTTAPVDQPGPFDLELTDDELQEDGPEPEPTLDDPVEVDVGDIPGVEEETDAVIEEVSIAAADVDDEQPTQPVEVSFSGTVFAGDTTPYIDFNEADYQAAQAAGKRILLFFYADWCPKCHKEHSQAQTAFDELNDANLVAFRVNYRDSDTDAVEEELAREFGISYQHTKILLEDGERVLKAPDTWDSNRYVAELA